MMDFERKLAMLQEGNADAMLDLLTMFRPLLIHYSLINGRFSEDLMQYLVLRFMMAVRSFVI